LGRDVESFFGSSRFLLVFFFSGLLGNVATYVLGANVPSAGASGAIFGLVGAEIAYLLRNRRLYGRMSRQQLSNLATLVVINLVFGFTMPGVNNLAHIGGLVGGLLLGLGLAPRLTIEWEAASPGASPGAWPVPGPVPRVVDRASRSLQAAVLVLAIVLLATGLQLGNLRWSQLGGRQAPSAMPGALLRPEVAPQSHSDADWPASALM
jgi:hypothetical protein